MPVEILRSFPGLLGHYLLGSFLCVPVSKSPLCITMYCIHIRLKSGQGNSSMVKPLSILLEDTDSILFILLGYNTEESNFREKGLNLVHSLGNVKAAGISRRWSAGRITPTPGNTPGRADACCCSVPFLSWAQFRILARERCHPQQTSHLTSVNEIMTITHGYVKRPASQENPDPISLTISTNHHSLNGEKNNVGLN